MSSSFFSKVIFTIVNLFYLLHGIGYLVSACLAVYLINYLNINLARLVLYFLITAISLIILSIFGFLTFRNLTKKLMITYSILILTGIICQIISTVSIIQSLPLFAEGMIKNDLIDKYSTRPISIKRNIQYLQQKNNCCGYHSFEDYKLPTNLIPDSCCQKYVESQSDQDQIGACALVELKLKKGCETKLSETYDEIFNESKKKMVIPIVLFFFIQFIIFSVTIAMTRSIKSKTDEQNSKISYQKSLGSF